LHTNLGALAIGRDCLVITEEHVGVQAVEAGKQELRATVVGQARRTPPR